jgi:predicted HAD superfamily Cof-like phosphohydrolase
MSSAKHEEEKSNFQKICEFQEAFEMHSFPNGITQEEILKNPDLIELRDALIAEEFNEFKQAINDKDITEMRDAIGDILYVVYGAAHTFGFDADADFATIHDSNMSKLCKTEEEAQQTVAKYEQDFKDGKTTYDTPYYYLNEKTGLWIVKNRSTGKVLKSINYTPVKFE